MRRLILSCLVCLVLILPAPAWSATQSNCIIGCKCAESEIQKISRILKIEECDSPLVLSKKSLVDVSKKTKVIGFKNVVIERIEKEAFQDFNDLESVIIEDSRIGYIDNSVFDLPELGTLKFAKTTFNQVPSLSSNYLEELIFTDCKLTQVPKLNDLLALSFINLANNLITDIDENTFAEVGTLEEVTLSNNSISRLPPNLFNNNPDFGNLNVDYNPIIKFELNSDLDLESLSLRHCKLTTFDRSTSKYLASLTTLDLSDNEISVLPIDAFEAMKELNNINLSNNKLVELDDDIFYENGKLDKIVLDNNPLSNLPNFQARSKVFANTKFSCKNCGLKSVEKVFANMPLLESVDLSDNKLQDIDGVFIDLKYLKELFLSNNEVTSFGIYAFAKNSELETLDLSGNPLLPLDPVVLAFLPMLKKLNISNANLEQPWSNHNAKLPALEQLFVKKNKFTVLTVKDLTILPKLEQLDIQDNPLSCTAEMYHLYNYLVQHSIYPGASTHENLGKDTVVYNTRQEWQAALPDDCIYDFGEEYVDDNELDDYNTEADDNFYTADDEDPEYDEDKDDIGVEASVLSPSGFNLAKASYILSITSVFILTALLVLFVAVMITLLILKRNKSFNMHNGNLPRLKIPLWHTTPGQKKHSGSVYRPLSEELSGPRTPIINRYEFKQTPQVHNSLP